MVKVKDILKIITWMCVLTGYASVFSYVSTYYSICFALLFALAVYLDFNRTLQASRWLLNAASVAVLLFSFSRITPELLVEPVLEALIILTAIKLLDEKKFRDYMQIHAMCMFLLVGSSFISLSVVFLLYFVILASLSTMSLVLLAYYSCDAELVISRQTLTSVLWHSLLICSIAIPASAIFFLILPRTNYPILSFLNKYSSARTGFTDTVTLGDVSDIQEDNNVILRAQMDPVDKNMLYWRGVVLDKFDGKSWKSNREESQAYRATPQGRAVNQTIYLEPYGDNYLFALDKPTSIEPEKSIRNRFGFRRHHNIDSKTRYKATSVLSEVLPEKEIDRDRHLQLPDGFSPRTRELSESLAAGKNDLEILRTFLHFMRDGEYKYSMDDLPVSDEPLEDFLFAAKKGNCEYYASSLAVMLRMAGVPARLVGGYKGGYYNHAGGYYMVLQKNAHIWVEAYASAHGWMRVDPTPPVEAASGKRAEDYLMKLRLFVDTINYYWSKFVLNYDFSRQLLLLKQIRSTFNKADLKFEASQIPYRTFATIAATASLLTFLLYSLWRGLRSRHEKLMAQFLKRMGRHGYIKGGSEGLEEFVTRIEKDELRGPASVFVAEFQKIYYKDRAFTQEDVKRLEASLKQM